jgi:hypothetical protein
MCSPLLVLIHQAADDTGELHIIIDCAYLRLCTRAHNRNYVRAMIMCSPQLLSAA